MLPAGSRNWPERRSAEQGGAKTSKNDLRDAHIAVTGKEISLVSPKQRYRYDVTTFRFERPLP